jgi:glucose-6-phosphate isomerase
MLNQIAPVAERQAWNSLAAHYQKVRELHLRKLFADNPKRGERMTAEAVGLCLDYSPCARSRSDGFSLRTI